MIIRTLWRSMRALVAPLLVLVGFNISIASPLPFSSDEHISNFHSSIRINQDGSMNVTETITVISNGKEIKRGIVREFPTRYRDHLGTNYAVGFSVHNVLHNGNPAVYHSEYASNGVRLFIGERDTFIPTGEHTYTISYTTNRQLGYFADHDELFWNITGNGWRLLIAQASFDVTLPKGIVSSDIQATGYTGYEGDLQTNLVIETAPQGTIKGHTTVPLLPHQGLAIAVAWPKGYVTQPTLLTTLYYFVCDNLPIIIMVLWLLLIIILYIFAWIKALPTSRPGTIIPLFEPPQGISPAEVACIDAMKYSDRALTATIVNLAVHDLVHIEHKKDLTMFNAAYYVLHKKFADGGVLRDSTYTIAVHERILAHGLFPGEDTRCRLDSSNSFVFAPIERFRHTVERMMDSYIDTQSELVSGLVIATVGVFGGVFVFSLASSAYAWLNYSVAWWIIIIAACGIHVWGAWLIKTYTVQGRRIHDAIEGFKLFLSTTEVDRIKMVGTPPTQSPQLYEKYLPYAIALGVEEQWSKQFEPLFAQMKTTGQEYRPLWYNFGHYPHFISHHFARNMASVVPSTIASGIRPGTTSGFSRGGGGAGRGGGGGGGGGW